MSPLLEKVLGVVKQKIRAKKLGHRRPARVRAAISRAMKGRSNFAGHKHTAGTKRIMSDSRGHDDQGKVGGTRWYKTSAYAKKQPDRRSRQKPTGYIPGR